VIGFIDEHVAPPERVNQKKDFFEVALAAANPLVPARSAAISEDVSRRPGAPLPFLFVRGAPKRFVR
jgi:hypothetical protein